jgi:hypothetical protein
MVAFAVEALAKETNATAKTLQKMSRAATFFRFWVIYFPPFIGAGQKKRYIFFKIKSQCRPDTTQINPYSKNRRLQDTLKKPKN